MRIVLATSRFTDSGGGVAVYAREFCRLLSERGHEILVISTEQDLAEEWCFGDREIRAVSFPVSGDRKTQCETARRMFERIVAFDPDVLVSSDHSWLVSFFPCFARRRVRISICHSSCARPIVLPAVARPEATDWIVTLSEAGAGWVVRHTQARQDQVVAIYNPVPEAGAPSRDAILRRAAERPLRLVFPGGSNGNKGADVMLRLAAAIQKSDMDCELVWMGRDLIQRYIPPESRNWIRLTGLVSHEEAEAQIARAHCLFLPSRGEGCPMTLLEALRSGCIPFVSDRPSAMRELVRDGESGFVLPVPEFSNLVGRLSDLARSVELRQRLMLGACCVYENKLGSERWVHDMMPL
ncbi:MAG TPA: glycosyltransferase family 4 protein, partial [Candidatus Sumerlaeota bacterium]|nr:glycosyltransferase family 4 protein [Candidatus Sumerlaeota bacterium]